MKTTMLIATSATTAILALALGTQAVPVPVPVLDVMQPPSLWSLVEKDVGTLDCKVAHTGTLGWTPSGASSPSGHVSLIGPKDSAGRSILHTTKSSGADVTPTKFDFLACTSNKSPSFIGNPPTSTTLIGHISPSGQSGKCLSASKLASSGAELVLEDCSLSDDSSQLFQSFSLISGNSVRFLGHQYGEGEDRVTDLRYQLTKSTAKLGDVLVSEVQSGAKAAKGKINLQFYQ